MQLTQTLFLAACAVSALALPLEESTSVQSSRDVLNILAGRASPSAVDCKGTDSNNHKEYTQKEVKSAYDSGKKKVKTEDCTKKDQGESSSGQRANGSSLINNNRQLGQGVGGERCEGLISSALGYKDLGNKGKLFEYRIQGSETDRVVWACHKKDGNKAGSSDFCLVMTHRGQDDNAFKPCDKK